MFSKKTTLAAIDRALLFELIIGVQKTFENAETLYTEASLLRHAGFLSHALFLHQISLEECAKIEILGGWATSMLMGYHVDLAKVTNALASHARKNRTNAYFLEPSEEEQAAQESGDFEAANTAFSQMQQDFHLKANTAKNASLYVDFKDGKFTTPNERTTPESVSEIARLNEKYLGLTLPKVEMLRKWGMAPDLISTELVYFEKRIKEVASEVMDDPAKVLHIVLEEMLARSRAAKSVSDKS